MSLINYKEIDFNESIDKTNKVINFNGQEIEVVNYLSANDKYDLIMITLQKSLEKNIYNPFKIDMYFDLNVVYLYTNIVFDAEDRLDEAALYDTLKRSGLMDAVKAEINSDELWDIKNTIWQLSEIITKYRNTFGAVVGSFIEQLPVNMEKAKEIISEFDPEKYQDILSMANQIKSGTMES
jgi:hypothetical protein